MHHAADQLIQVDRALGESELFSGNQEFLFGARLERDELIAQKSRGPDRCCAVDGKFQPLVEIELHPRPQIRVQIDGLYPAHANAPDPHRGTRGEPADIVEGGVENEPAGIPDREAAHLERQISDQAEAHQNEEPHEQIAIRCGLHGLPPRSDAPERRQQIIGQKDAD